MARDTSRCATAGRAKFQGRHRGGFLALAALGLLAVAAPRAGSIWAPGTVHHKHIPRFAFDKDESPFNVPLMLRVMLVNMGPNAEPSAFRIDTDDFERTLFQLLPGHQPHCAETGEKLAVSYEIYYDVVHTSQADCDSLSAVLKKNLKVTTEVQHSDSITGADKAATNLSSDKKGFVSVYDIIVKGEVEAELERIYHIYAETARSKYHSTMPMREGVYGLMILNMDKELIAPEGTRKQGDAATSFAYRYKTGPNGVDSGSDTFITSSRFAVVDLSAGPSLYGSTKAGEGAGAHARARAFASHAGSHSLSQLFVTFCAHFPTGRKNLC